MSLFLFCGIQIFHLADGMDPMFIVIPIRYESFVTFIELNDIVFKSGKVIYLDKLPDKRNKDKHLIIKESLKNYPAISYDELPVKINLEEF